MRLTIDKLLVVMTIGVLVAGCSKTNRLTIEGNIGDNEKVFFYNANFDMNKPIGIPYVFIEADQSGDIHFETDSIKEGYYKFMYNSLCYLRPGMNLAISLKKNITSFNSHPYLNKLSEVHSNRSMTNLTNNIKKYTFSEYCDKVDELFKQRYQFLEEIEDKRFKKVEQSHLQLSELMQKVIYALYLPKFEYTEEYLDIFKKIKFDKDHYTMFPEWRKWLKNYFYIVDKIEGKEIDKNLKLQLNYLSTIELKQAWLWDRLEYSDSYDDETYNNLLLAKSILTDSIQLARIDQNMQVIKKCLKGQPAYEFEFENETGEKVKLSDFKGQSVYIDCWGVSCPACLAQMPYLNKIEEEFKDENIVFLSICMTDKDERWKKLVKKFNIGGTKLIARDASKMNDFYNIRYIPRYILIDKEGKLVSSNALRPNDEKLPALLKSLL